MTATADPHRQNRSWRAPLLVAGVALAAECLLAWCIGLDRPLRADEPHFVKAIVRFGTSPLSLDLLAHYDAMSGPLPFVLYGTWGRLCGFEPQTLRMFSILIAVATYVVWFWFLQTESGSLRLAALGTAFIVLHPYMIYLSLFIYTDMLAILCLIGTLAAIRREKPGWLALALCGGVLNRQYLVFVTVAAAAYWSLQYVQRRHPRAWIHLLAVGCSVIPLAGLCWLWGGLCPDGALKSVYPDPHLTFHLSSLHLYISLCALYVLPILALKWRSFSYDRQTILVAAAGSCLYWLSPVGPSRSAVEAGTHHVGILHQTLARLSGGDFAAQGVFFFGFALGLIFVSELIADAVARWKSGQIDFQLFLDFAVLAFLAVMPWSYLHWEKYLMPLLPVLVLRILLAPSVRHDRVLQHAQTGDFDFAHVARL